MSARHTLPFVCFACRKSFKIDIEANAENDLTHFGVTQACPQCAGEMPFAGRYFKTPPQKDEKQWAKAQLLWQRGWFTEGIGFRGAPKSLCDAQTALTFAEQEKRIKASRQRRNESETKWRRASRRRRDF